MRILGIRIQAETGQAESALKRVEKGLSDVEKSADGASKATGGVELSLGNIVKAAGGYIAVQQSLENIIKFSQGSLTAFTEQETAIKRLTTALQASGQATPDIIRHYDELANTFQKITRFSDDAIYELEALFTLTGKVGPEQMGAALSAATDLAVGLGKTLPEAGQLLIQALDGNVRSLGRYLTEAEQADIKTRGASAAFEAIRVHFGGQAQADLETFGGRVANVGNRFNELQERAGDLIARALLPILDIFDSMPGSLQTVTLILGTVTALFAPMAAGVLLVAQAFGVNLIPLLTGPLMAAWGGLSTMLTGTIIPLIGTALPFALRALAAFFSVPAGLVIAGILAVVAIWKNWDTIGPMVERVYTAVKTWLVDKFAAVVNMIREKVGQVTGFFKDMYDKVVGGSYVPDMITGVEVQFGRLGSIMVVPTQTATQAVIRAFENMGGVVLKSMQGVFDGLQGLIASRVPSLFGGAGLFGQMMRAGLAGIFGPGGIAATLVWQGMEAIGNLVWKGLKKIGGWFKNVFGGPSESELQGREFVADFEETLSNMLTDTQRLETGNVAWKNTIVAIRDRYLELGLTNEEALRDTERLWASSREGAEAAMRVIEEIKRKMEGGIHVPVVIEPPRLANPLIPNLAPDYTTWPTPVFHSGGVVPGLVARPIMALGGEGVLSHRGMRSIGGPSGLAALNRGAAPTGDINLYVNGYLDSKQSALHLARLVRTELDQELQRRRRMSRG